MIAAGGDRVEDIRVLANDLGLGRLLGDPLPSPDGLLRFLNGFDDPHAWDHRPPDEKSWVPPESMALQALFEINRQVVARAASPTAPTATIDHDGTLIEAHKRDALLSYEGVRGYQPLVSVWAEEDLIVGDEFRDGNVPANKDPLASVRRAFDALPTGVTKRFFRGDSGDYSTPLLKYLAKAQIAFAISADMGEPLRAQCAAVPETEWVQLPERERDFVHVAEVEFTPGDWPKSAAPLRYVAIRFTPIQRDLFEAQERSIRYFAIVTNRPMPATADESSAPDAIGTADLVHWHRDKAGTIEHVHRALKDELAAGVLPCQRFGANAAWFRINALAYNVLTFLKRCALPERYRDARPKRLRFAVFTMPGRLVFHQRQLSVDVSADPQTGDELIAARRHLLDFHRTPKAAP